MKVPVRGAEPAVVPSMTAGVDVHVVLPDSKPGFPNSCEVAVQVPPGAVTVTETVVVCEPDAAEPVIVNVKVPAAAAVVVLTVRVPLPPEVTGVGEMEAVTPTGVGEADSDTVCALPDVVAVLMVAVAEFPATIFKLFGLAEMEKSLAGGGGGVPVMALPLGLPMPVGPSYPATAVQR